MYWSPGVSLPNASSHRFLSVNVRRINWCESTHGKEIRWFIFQCLKNEFLLSDSIDFLSCVLKVHLWVTRWRLSTVRMNWNLMESLSALLSPLSTCWPPGHLLGAPYNVNGSFCIPCHWRCHFIPCLRHKASRASVDAANETIAAEPMQGGCRQESASVISLVTSDSVPS